MISLITEAKRGEEWPDNSTSPDPDHASQRLPKVYKGLHRPPRNEIYVNLLVPKRTKNGPKGLH